MMHNGILLEQQKQATTRCKRSTEAKARSYNRHTVYEEEIPVQRTQELIQALEPIQEPPAPLPTHPAQPVLPAPASAPARLRLPTCEKCSDIGHRSNNCPVRWFD